MQALVSHIMRRVKLPPKVYPDKVDDAILTKEKRANRVKWAREVCDTVCRHTVCVKATLIRGYRANVCLLFVFVLFVCAACTSEGSGGGKSKGRGEACTGRSCHDSAEGNCRSASS